MLANFTKETVSAGGTGALTLSGAATGFQSFNSAIGTNIRFPYIIRDGNAWETGKGYISTSTNFVRDSFYSSSTGSALNVTTSAEVYIGDTAHEMSESCQLLSGAEVISGHVSEPNSGISADIDANEIHYFPFYLNFSDTFDAISFYVSAAGAGNLRLALYDVKDGQPDRMIAVHDTSLSISTTGKKTATFDGGSIFLSRGWYFIGINSDISGPQFEAIPLDSIGANMLGVDLSATSNIIYNRLWKARTYAAMPNPADVSILSTHRLDDMITLALRQG